MSTYYTVNNQFLGSIPASNFSVAAAHLRSMGAKFTTKKSGETFVVRFSFCPEFLRAHLLSKYAPKVKTKTPAATKRYWATKSEYEAAMSAAVSSPSSPLTAKADNKYRTRKPDPASPHSADYYNPLAHLTTDDAMEADFAPKVVPVQTEDVLLKNAIASGLDSRPVASAVGNASAVVSAQHLYHLTVSPSKKNPQSPCLLDLAKRYCITNRHKMNKAQLVNALSGLVTLADFE